MRTKSQVASQIFIYIVALLLAALILIYGYRAIGGFISRTEDISLIKFKTDIDNSVKTIATDFGSIRVIDLSVPGKFSKVCLLDLTKSPSPDICTNQLHENFNPLICDAWSTPGNTQNVFLVPMADLPMSISDMDIDNGYLCVLAQKGKVRLKLQGLGNRTGVSVP